LAEQRMLQRLRIASLRPDGGVIFPLVGDRNVPAVN